MAVPDLDRAHVRGDHEAGGRMTPVAGSDPPPESRGTGGDEKGSVTILTTAVLFLAGVLVLVSLDLMRTLAAGARAQTAADAAALAAAQEIAVPTGTWSPQDAAAYYAERNGATLRSCTCEPRSSEAVVEVEAPLDLVFLGPDRTVTGRARAVIGIAGTEAAGRMALDVRYGMGTGSSEPRPGPQGPARRPPGPRGRGLHAGQAGPPPGVPPG